MRKTVRLPANLYTNTEHTYGIGLLALRRILKEIIKTHILLTLYIVLRMFHIMNTHVPICRKINDIWINYEIWHMAQIVRRSFSTYIHIFISFFYPPKISYTYTFWGNDPSVESFNFFFYQQEICPKMRAISAYRSGVNDPRLVEITNYCYYYLLLIRARNPSINLITKIDSFLLEQHTLYSLEIK